MESEEPLLWAKVVVHVAVPAVIGWLAHPVMLVAPF